MRCNLLEGSTCCFYLKFNPRATSCYTSRLRECATTLKLLRAKRDGTPGVLRTPPVRLTISNLLKRLNMAASSVTACVRARNGCFPSSPSLGCPSPAALACSVPRVPAGALGVAVSGLGKGEERSRRCVLWRGFMGLCRSRQFSRTRKCLRSITSDQLIRARFAPRGLILWRAFARRAVALASRCRRSVPFLINIGAPSSRPSPPRGEGARGAGGRVEH